MKKTKLTEKLFFLKKKWIIGLLIAAVVIGLWRHFTSDGNDAETSQVKKGAVSEELILLGDVQAEEHAQLLFLSPGELSWVGVSEGEEVKKGQLLVRLDPSVVNANYEIALADLRAAEASLERVYDDIQGREDDETYLLREARTQAESTKDRAYRAYTIAKRNLSNLNIRSPFDGIVTNITHPYTGVNIFQTEPQIEIVNPDSLYFRVRADQTELADIRVGQSVVIVLDALLEEEYFGEVAYVGFTPKPGEIGTVYLVKVSFDKTPDIQKVRIGMTGDARLILREKKDALYLPPRFVKTDADGKYVNLGRINNKVYVEVGLEGEDKVEIISGVSEGDLVYD